MAWAISTLRVGSHLSLSNVHCRVHDGDLPFVRSRPRFGRDGGLHTLMTATIIRRLCVLLAPALFALHGSAATAAPKPAPTKADISYGPHPHQTLDVYVPAEGKGPFPVLVWFGALWKAGRTVPPTHALLPNGCAAIGASVRVMEDAVREQIKPPVSVCLLDARRAVQYVRLHAAEWNIDPDRIAVGGSSQGALPALYVACSGERANPNAEDPVERVSTRVTCVGAHRSQPSIDPKRMQEWVPGVEWGAPAFGYSFAESLKRRDELVPLINEWSPDALVREGAPPIYFENNWDLSRPDDVGEVDYKVHSPRWGLGFQKIAQEHGVTCYVKYPGHPSEKYKDIWDFFVQELKAAPRGTK